MNPFQAKHSVEFPTLLDKLDGTIMLTTYQSGKVIMLSSNGEKIYQLVRDFDRPMGVSFYKNMMALALRTNITIFKNSEELAKTYPKKLNVYDSLYYPVAQNITSYVDIHDITFSKQGVVAVNTFNNALIKINGQYSFEIIWKPPFITDFQHSDACHLNGVCVDENNNIRYVTAFGESNQPQGWRTNKLNGGFLMDITTNKFIAKNLAMPHSPRVYKNELYVLLSASEKLVKVDRENGKLETIAKIDGFIRGLSFYENYAFIGVSKLRKSHTFGDLPIARKRLFAGVVIIDLITKEKIAEIFYDGVLEEIYDVHFIPKSKRVNIINHFMAIENPAIITPQFESWIETREKKEIDKENKREGG